MLESRKIEKSKAWFEQHVTLFGKPYTLDTDQARAVFDDHQNTLVTARAGSGKTRVIVAKIAYLIASGKAELNEIAAFMFNRTAAAEVNERIGAVEVDGVCLRDYCKCQKVKVASTFHKYALDIVKRSGEHPEIISESEHDNMIKTAVNKVLTEQKRKTSGQEYMETLRLASSFVARAGQKYIGEQGLQELCQDAQAYIDQHEEDINYKHRVWLHRLCLAVYQEYLLSLNFPKIDFNILMARAIQILERQENDKVIAQNSKYKYIMVDEYQDFSFLFFRMVQAIRQNCPAAHLFAVGDDWQAINRFAGSDVNYFMDFAHYFPENVTNIPLNTNYRSARRIVENANNYMLKYYNPRARKAVPFSKEKGKVKRIKVQKTRFDASDLCEDGLGDARYMLILAEICNQKLKRPLPPKYYQEAAQLLKTTVKIMKKHRKTPVMLLHRHNFTSCAGVTLENFLQALERVLLEQRIMPPEDFQRQVRAMTMHKSKGLEAEIVILLEVNRDQVLSIHPHATVFELFGDSLNAEKADQQRLLYVAMTRAKQRLYILSSDQKCPI